MSTTTNIAGRPPQVDINPMMNRNGPVEGEQCPGTTEPSSHGYGAANPVTAPAYAEIEYPDVVVGVGHLLPGKPPCGKADR